jgi:hypothetical protein
MRYERWNFLLIYFGGRNKIMVEATILLEDSLRKILESKVGAKWIN